MAQYLKIIISNNPIMKKLIFILSCAFFISPIIFAQITVDGQIDIAINIPVPEIVIVVDDPVPAPQPKPAPEEIIIIEDEPEIIPVDGYPKNAQGTIINQNGPFEGRIDYKVQSAVLEDLTVGEKLSFILDSGDVLSMIIYTKNYDDINYIYYDDGCFNCNDQENSIVHPRLNGFALAVRNANLSLQTNNQHFTAVLNLHTLNEGDFNGTVQF